MADDWRPDLDAALDAFLAVSELARHRLKKYDLPCEYCSAPHEPPNNLPSGKMAVYAFWGCGEWLMIGKAGPNSQAPYTGHHYNLRSAGSTLAASLASDYRMSSVASFDAESLAAWIKTHTHRANILLDVKHGPELLALLEAFLYARLRPRYEGE